MNHNAITDIPGIMVGHWTNIEAATGCTVVLCPDGAVAGVDVRGGAPGTREIALLDPVCKVEQVQGVLLSGGSAFGLAAADGVMQWLEERGHGFDVGGFVTIPIVPAAILFDLAIGDANVRPDRAAGYAACEAASDGPVLQGCVGAGTGATVGKLLGPGQVTKSGLGTASKIVDQDIIVSAITAVNAVGEVIDSATQRVIAGVRNPNGEGFLDSIELATSQLEPPTSEMAARNTTIALIATNAKLTKTEATKVAQMAHDGLARVIRPIHTMMDGDTIFALSLGERTVEPGVIGILAAEVLANAVLQAVYTAKTLHGLPAARDLSENDKRTDDEST